MRTLIITILALCWSVATAQTTGDAVTETSRDGLRVDLLLRSGPHPQPGDYPIVVRLPPDYLTSTRAYRVIYSFDSKDLHSEHDVLVSEGLIHPAILVAITNKTATSREWDLVPWADPARGIGGGLPAFADLIINDLKPYIDSHFRTLPSAEHTGVAGNSFGGLATGWLGYFRSSTFGLAGVMQPSWWWSNFQMLTHLQTDTTPKPATRFWIMSGDQDSPIMWQTAKRGVLAMIQRGWVEGEDLAYHHSHNTGHTLQACRDQHRDMLYFLLRAAPVEIVRTELTATHGPQLLPIRSISVGAAAEICLDIHYQYNMRVSKIAPDLQIATPGIVTLSDSALGLVTPIGNGWTTVSSTYQGFRAVIDVEGMPIVSQPQPPARAAAPQITYQPDNLTLPLTSTATFRVAADGPGPLTFQWRHNGQLIPNATTSTLTLTNLNTTHQGSYTAIVTNTIGSVASSVATLTATPAPVAPLITILPASQTVTVGNPVTFSVAASGSPTPTFRWQKGGVNISGATGSSYQIASVYAGDAGNYTVVATNSVSSVTSSIAALTVSLAPVASVQTRNVTNATTLTDVLNEAAANPTARFTINLAAGTYTLGAMALPSLGNDIKIQGPTSGSPATIDGTAQPDGVIFNVTGSRVVIANVRFINAAMHAIAIQPGANTGTINTCNFASSRATAAIHGRACADWTITGNAISGVAGTTATAQPAIFFHTGAGFTTITNNLILNCDQGIRLGSGGGDSVGGGRIRNNMIADTRTTRHGGPAIRLESLRYASADVDNNTVYQAGAYANSIEYTNCSYILNIRNNLVRKAISGTTSPQTTLTTNNTSAVGTWFVDPTSCDLHLATAVTGVADAGTAISGFGVDIDGDPRPNGTAYDIGADEYTSSSSSSSSSGGSSSSGSSSGGGGGGGAPSGWFLAAVVALAAGRRMRALQST